MTSIRKAKKLLKLYPPIIEIHCRATPEQAVELIKNIIEPTWEYMPIVISSEEEETYVKILSVVNNRKEYSALAQKIQKQIKQ